ncbi:virion structural protein [Staphylococcus phage PG-2021_15]
MGNFLKHIHPLLRRKKNENDYEDVNHAIINSLETELSEVEKDTITSKAQSSLKQATGEYLDTWGDWFNVIRKKDESDDKYRERIIKYFLLKRGTNNAIIDALRDYLDDYDSNISIYEPFTDIFYTNKSKLNSEAHLMGEYYRFAVIDITIGRRFPLEIIDIINSFKPAGVKFILTYDGSYNLEGDGIIQMPSVFQKISTYTNLDIFNGYDDIMYGHINLSNRKSLNVSYTDYGNGENTHVDIFHTNKSKINSEHVLSGDPSIGSVFYNNVVQSSKVFTPKQSSNPYSMNTELNDSKTVDYTFYNNSGEKDNNVGKLELSGSQGVDNIYIGLDVYKYFQTQYNDKIRGMDSSQAIGVIKELMTNPKLAYKVRAMVPYESGFTSRLQLFNFRDNKWETINSTQLNIQWLDTTIELGNINDFLSNNGIIFIRINNIVGNNVSLELDLLDIMFSNMVKNVYTIKPYLGNISYESILSFYNLVDAFKVSSLSNGDIISKLGYEPMGYVRVVGESNEPKNIIHINDTAEPPIPVYEFQILTDENDVFNYRDTKYLIEFDIAGEDASIVKDLYVYPAFILEDFSDYNIINSTGVKVSITNTKGRAIIEVPSYVDFEKYPKMFIQLSTYNYQEKEDLKPGEVIYAEPYKISFSNLTVQDIYESTDQAIDPTTRINNAFVDNRTIDGTPGRGNSGQDGNILNNEAYTLASPAMYNRTKYDILTNLTLRKPIETGKTYTVQIKGNLGSDRTSWLLYNSNGLFNELHGQSGILPSDYDPKTGIYTKTFVAPTLDYDTYGANLLSSYKGNNEILNTITSTKDFTINGWGLTLYKGSYISNVTKPGKEYTLSYDMEITKLSNEKLNQVGYGLILFDRTTSKYALNTRANLTREVGQKKSVSVTFTMPEGNFDIIGYSSILTPDGTLDTFPRSFDDLKITNLKLELGSKATTWSEAPTTLPLPERKRLNTSLRVYQYPSSGTSQSSIEWVKVEEGSQATKAGYQFAYYTMAYLPKGEYDIYYKAKVEVQEGDLDMVTILDFPNTTTNTDPKFLVPIENGYVKGKISVNRTDTEGRLLIYAGLAGATAGNKIRFSELEVYYSTDPVEYKSNELLAYNAQGDIVPSYKYEPKYTTANSVYNGQKTYSDGIGLYGTRTDIAKLKIVTNAPVPNAKLQYSYNGINWKTLKEYNSTTIGEEIVDNEIIDLYGLSTVNYSDINPMSKIVLKNLWDITLGTINSTDGSISNMSNDFFNAVWTTQHLYTEHIQGVYKVLDDVVNGIIDNTVGSITQFKFINKILNNMILDNLGTVNTQRTDKLLAGSPIYISDVASKPLSTEEIDVYSGVRALPTETETYTNNNILKNSYDQYTIKGSEFVKYELKEPITEDTKYTVEIHGDIKPSFTRLAVGNSNGSFNEVFVYPKDFVNGVAKVTYVSRKDQYDVGKQRLNNDYRIYVQPYDDISSTITRVILTKET